MAYNVYNDIQARTNGDIYIGVVGPVRTGKSTFIKRFMDLLVIPNIKDVHSKERAVDELPQSANGRIIMTTEPKFIPKEAAMITLEDGTNFRIRLIDCVGYMVEGAMGHLENDQERMVKTPWFEEEIPFIKAAEIGTKKVINEHSTIGMIITTDGSFSDIEREAYVEAEKKTIEELKQLGKPFVVLLNSSKPFSQATQELAVQLEEEYNTKVIPINCDQLKKNDISKIMEELLAVFPIEEIAFHIPPWLDMLDNSHYIKQEIIENARKILDNINTINDAKKYDYTDGLYIKKIKLDTVDLQKGIINIVVDIDNSYYYKTLSDLTGVDINGEYELISTIKELSGKKQEYEKVSKACQDVKMTGYGVVTPDIGEIIIEEPEIIRHGNKYGVKIKAQAPSTNMILANINTEIAPIVGSEEQAQDLINYIQDNAKDNKEGIWDTNIFGKSIKQLIEEGINAKAARMTEETKDKMQDTLQKIINESSGGVICIII